MISKFARIPALLAASALLFAPSAFAKKKPVDLSVFAGNYYGTGTVNLSGTNYPLTVALNFKPSKKGNSAVITVAGSLNASGTIYPISNTFTLAKGGAMSVASFIFFISGGGSSSVGTYSAHKNRIVYSSVITAFPTATVTGTVVTNPKAKKQTLSLGMNVANSGSLVYAFAFDLTKKGKKK
ncbi:MAG: hypothetical protein PHC88_08270 [Terrimicrobiaceae bacterium]|nr:hypothetical protein [Terrimicrobiaceae bacterium]